MSYLDLGEPGFSPQVMNAQGRSFKFHSLYFKYVLRAVRGAIERRFLSEYWKEDPKEEAQAGYPSMVP